MFGGIAGLAALLIAGQVIGRRIRLNADDLNVLRALGADPAMTMSDGLIGTLGSILAGSLLAGLVAVGLSPLAPLGPVRPLLRGRVARRLDGRRPRGGAVAGEPRARWRWSWPTGPHPTGWRSACNESGARAWRGRRRPPVCLRPRSRVSASRSSRAWAAARVPVRSAILGAVLAVTVVVTTVTFGSSMNTLVSHPALYGWNWSYDIDGGGGLGDIPGARVAAAPRRRPLRGGMDRRLLLDAPDRRHERARSWAGPPTLRSDLPCCPDTDSTGPTRSCSARPPWPNSTSGWATRSKWVAPGRRRTTLKIVGTATMPSIGVAGSAHLEMGTGALLSYTLIPPGARNVFDVTVPGPNAILVRLKKRRQP